MTKWKLMGSRTTLILMHAHNEWSAWYHYLLVAADKLGIEVGATVYKNCSGDGSYDTEYYVNTTWLARVGGMDHLKEVAEEMHTEWAREHLPACDW